MNKIMFFAAVLALCTPHSALCTQSEADYPPKPEGMDEAEYDFLIDNGGWWEKPNSGSGVIQIVNGQKRVPATEFKSVIRTIQFDVNVHFAVVEKPMEKAEITIELIDDPKAKSFVVYPDECRAVANVAPLAADNPSQDVLNARVRKTLLRAFGYVGGATGGAEGNALDIMKDLKRLDAAKQQLPGDYVLRCDRFLERAGVKKYYRLPYRVACQKGYANQPTNQWEKLVWDEVHQKPTKGLKIKFDPKKGE